ncbi:hypothetical protein LTR93_011189 [Exophiala xenobiotica]|nr:hypothetical protein LTR93_011189 [Exophiala xenobiotica]
MTPNSQMYCDYLKRQKFLPQDASGGLYWRYTLRGYFPVNADKSFIPGLGPFKEPGSWHGAPMAALKRVFQILGDPTIEGFPDQQLEYLWKLRKLYSRNIAPMPPIDASEATSERIAVDSEKLDDISSTAPATTAPANASQPSAARVDQRRAPLTRYTDEELAEFKKDPRKFEEYREYVEHLLNTVHTVAFSNSEASLQSTALFTESMQQKLAKKLEVFDSLIPDFPPVCRRLTPGGGYLEAVCEDNVDLSPIRSNRSMPTALKRSTGNSARSMPSSRARASTYPTPHASPVTGLEGVSLQKIWDERCPEAYVSIFPEQMPNYFVSLGPNGTPPTGSAIVVVESQCQYIIETITKCQREGYESVQVKLSALRQFSDFIDSYMPRTVYVKNCKSWFKRGQSNGRVVALFPGSSLALRELLKHPRWEDFDFTPLKETLANSFA